MNEVQNITVSLLQLEAQLQGALSAREVAFTAANESFGVIKYEQAVVWRRDLFNAPIVTAASGLADLSLDSPYIQWLGRAIRSFPQTEDNVLAVSLSSLPENIVSEGSEWCAEHLLICKLKGPDGLGRGGMMFSRSEPFAEQEVAMVEWIVRATGYALWAWRRTGRSFWHQLGTRKRMVVTAAVLVVLGLIGAMPVQLNALASAEITPQNPIPVTSPVEGIIKEIVVKPNQTVRAGEVLAVLDDTALRNRLTVAQKALEIARADSQRAINKAFGDESSRAELQVLVARVREKSAEVAYTSQVLERLTINAPQGGVAVFSNADEFTGKPVQPGERIMIVADPSLIRVTAFVAPDDAVQLEPGAEMKVFLNIDPLNPLDARVLRSSYEAIPQADGTLAYVVQGELLEGHGFPRIGLRGTAKIYAEKVSLAYYIFRKPLAFVRQHLGF